MWRKLPQQVRSPQDPDPLAAVVLHVLVGEARERLHGRPDRQGLRARSERPGRLGRSRSGLGGPLERRPGPEAETTAIAPRARRSAPMSSASEPTAGPRLLAPLDLALLLQLDPPCCSRWISRLAGRRLYWTRPTGACGLPLLTRPVQQALAACLSYPTPSNRATGLSPKARASFRMVRRLGSRRPRSYTLIAALSTTAS